MTTEVPGWKHCPFCGRTVAATRATNAAGWWVLSHRCGAVEIVIEGDRLSDVLEAWNARALSEDRERLATALLEHVESRETIPRDLLRTVIEELRSP